MILKNKTLILSNGQQLSNLKIPKSQNVVVRFLNNPEKRYPDGFMLPPLIPSHPIHAIDTYKGCELSDVFEITVRFTKHNKKRIVGDIIIENKDLIELMLDNGVIFLPIYACPENGIYIRPGIVSNDDSILNLYGVQNSLMSCPITFTKGDKR